jgi:tetratricopeptide (TPR) repeat protein
MGMGMWDAAQAAIDALAAKNPLNKRYNALACYARGRRAQLEGNLRIAQIELNDALKLDPDLEPAKSAVAELYARRK